MSGDLGRFDAKGCLEIVGRKKDLIIRGGHNIHPAKIEDLAMRHRRWRALPRFRSPDERLGEKVCLSVIFHEGAGAEPDELLAHLHQAGLSRYDMPEYFIAMDAYPLTASGKILKRELAEWARTGQIRPVPVRWTEASAARRHCGRGRAEPMAIHMSRIDEVALITLDRPEALNALSFGQIHDLEPDDRFDRRQRRARAAGHRRRRPRLLGRGRHQGADGPHAGRTARRRDPRPDRCWPSSTICACRRSR